jgi:hypothetical protein
VTGQGHEGTSFGILSGNGLADDNEPLAPSMEIPCGFPVRREILETGFEVVQNGVFMAGRAGDGDESFEYLNE